MYSYSFSALCLLSFVANVSKLQMHIREGKSATKESKNKVCGLLLLFLCFCARAYFPVWLMSVRLTFKCTEGEDKSATKESKNKVVQE